MTNTKTQIEYFHNHILLIPAYKTPDIHSHLASHLIIAINGNLKCVIENESIETKMICIASDVSHTAYMDQGQMVTFVIDETSNYSKTLEKLYLKGSKYSIINDELMYRKICDVWNNNKNDLKKLDDEILKLCLLESSHKNIDPRAKEVLDILEDIETIPNNIMDILSEKLNLSKSRVSHIFKENMGISIKRYLVLEKMKKCYEYFKTTGSITNASINAGFYSSSHFATTCKKMFGISFSELEKSKK